LEYCWLEYCTGFIIKQFNFLNVKLLIGGSRFTIEDNKFSSKEDCIFIESSDEFEIRDNIFSDGLVDLWHCTDVVVENNLFESTVFLGSQKGLGLYTVKSLTLKHNSFKVGGINLILDPSRDIYHFRLFDEFINNTIDTQTILLIYNESNKTVTENFGQLILLNCTNILISNHSLAEVNAGIIISDSSNCTIVKNNFSNCFNALNIYYSTNCFIYNNSIINSYEIGMFLISSDYNIVKFNQIQNGTSFGLYLWRSSNNQINGQQIVLHIKRILII
jgi:parallel beta-helix repeat protein